MPRPDVRSSLAARRALCGLGRINEVGRLVAQEAERETIGRVLEQTNWNRKQAARLLGVSYKTLLQKIRGCGLEPSP